MTRAICGALGFAALACAQPYGTQPKAKAEDYAAHAGAAEVAIGGEYLVRTLPVGGQSFWIRDYLVIEIALYPPKGQPLEVRSGAFTLRINGKKQELFAQSPGMVAAALKYEDWNMHPRMEAGVGPVIIGRPEQVPRFPGDQRPEQSRVPQSRMPPKVPQQTPGGVERPEPQTAVEAVMDAAFPDGAHSGPVSGFLFFAYRGKPKSVRSLELVYHRGDEQTVIKFF